MINKISRDRGDEGSTRTNCIASRMLCFYYFIDVQQIDDMSILALSGADHIDIDHVQISNQVIICESKLSP